jgi:hypothetical protein
VVAPAIADAQVAARESLARETQRAHETHGAHVARLHVDFHAMQGERPERRVEREAERFLHQTLAGVGPEPVIAEIGALERAAHDLGEVEHAHRRVVVAAQGEEPDVRAREHIAAAEARAIGLERVARQRRDHPARVQPPAPPRGLEKSAGVGRAGRPKIDALANQRRLLGAGWHNDILSDERMRAPAPSP